MTLGATVPASAFNAFSLGSRSLTASVVADAGAYQALTGGACTIHRILGGSCVFTVTNKATAKQTYFVNKTADVHGVVQTHSPASTGEIAVGSSSAITAQIKAQPLGAPDVCVVEWSVKGTRTGTLSAERTRYRMTITYATI